MVCRPFRYVSLAHPNPLSVFSVSLCPNQIAFSMLRSPYCPLLTFKSDGPPCFCLPHVPLCLLTHAPFKPGTACWPCRQRKVKCDNKQPCENCVKREHPQLCSYKPNRSAKSTASADTAGHVNKKRALSIEDQDHGSREMSGDPKADPALRTFGIPFRPSHKTDRDGFAYNLTPISVEPESAEVTRYLGQNSIPALLREQDSTDNQKEGVDHIRQDMRSILGLDNSAPFPLMSSRHLEKMTVDISAELPSDREVYKYVGVSLLVRCWWLTVADDTVPHNIGYSALTRRSHKYFGVSLWISMIWNRN